MKPNPVVGQRLFSLNIGNAARGREQRLTPVIVASVGRKYFSVKGESDTCFERDYHLGTWREKTEYSANSELYVGEQEWLDKCESERICRVASDAFCYGKNVRGLPLSALREIERILNDTHE